MKAVKWDFITTAKLMQLSMGGELTSDALVKALCRRLAKTEKNQISLV